MYRTWPHIEGRIILRVYHVLAFARSSAHLWFGFPPKPREPWIFAESKVIYTLIQDTSYFLSKFQSNRFRNCGVKRDKHTYILTIFISINTDITILINLVTYFAIIDLIPIRTKEGTLQRENESRTYYISRYLWKIVK